MITINHLFKWVSAKWTICTAVANLHVC